VKHTNGADAHEHGRCRFGDAGHVAGVEEVGGAGGSEGVVVLLPEREIATVDFAVAVPVAHGEGVVVGVEAEGVVILLPEREVDTVDPAVTASAGIRLASCGDQ